MADDNIVEPLKEEQSTTPPPEEPTQVEEEPTPAKAENVVEDPEKAELRAKVERQSALLRASKDEALRLKKELEVRMAQPVQAQEDIQPVNSADVAAFKALARAAGIPLKEEIQQQTYTEKMETAKEKFLQEHPEYSKVGDEKSDQAWDRLKEELAQYKAPEDPQKWYSLLQKAHRDISSTPELQLEKGKSLGMAQANLNASLGGGSSGAASTPTKKKQTPEQRAVAEEFEKIIKTRSYYKK